MIAEWSFRPADPRAAVSIANVGFAHRLAGRSRKAGHCYRQALDAWAHVSEAIDQVSIRETPLSSLHHMRMQARHRDTYRANIQTRLRKFAEETKEGMEACASCEKSPRDYFGRWAGEKPPGYDGRRVILSACLLLAVDSASLNPAAGDA